MATSLAAAGQVGQLRAPGLLGVAREAGYLPGWQGRQVAVADLQSAHLPEPSQRLDQVVIVGLNRGRRSRSSSERRRPPGPQEPGLHLARSCCRQR